MAFNILNVQRIEVGMERVDTIYSSLLNPKLWNKKQNVDNMLTVDQKNIGIQGEKGE